MYVDQSGELVFGYWGSRMGYFTLIRYLEKGPLEPGYVACKVTVLRLLGRDQQIALTDRKV